MLSSLKHTFGDSSAFSNKEYDSAVSFSLLLTSEGIVQTKDNVMEESQVRVEFGRILNEESRKSG